MSEINFLNIIQVLVAIALIGFILIQRGPGATAGSAFGGGGGGASGTVFGAKGSGSFLTKATAILATAFFIITMLIAVDASDKFASTGTAAEQDLGVFGSLDDASTEATMIPVESDATTSGIVTDAIDATDELIDGAASEVNDSVDNVIDSVNETTEEVIDDAEQAVETEDGGNG